MVWNGENTFGYVIYSDPLIFVGLQSKETRLSMDDLHKIWKINWNEEIPAFYLDGLANRFNTFTTCQSMNGIETTIKIANLSDNVLNEIKKVKELWKTKIVV